MIERISLNRVIFYKLQAEKFKSEDGRIILAEGDKISREEWEGFHHSEQTKFRPVFYKDLVFETKLLAESLANTLESFLNFELRKDGEKSVENYRPLKEKMEILVSLLHKK